MPRGSVRWNGCPEPFAADLPRAIPRLGCQGEVLGVRHGDRGITGWKHRANAVSCRFRVKKPLPVTVEPLPAHPVNTPSRMSLLVSCLELRLICVASLGLSHGPGMELALLAAARPTVHTKWKRDGHDTLPRQPASFPSLSLPLHSRTPLDSREQRLRRRRLPGSVPSFSERSGVAPEPSREASIRLGRRRAGLRGARRRSRGAAMLPAVAGDRHRLLLGLDGALRGLREDERPLARHELHGGGASAAPPERSNPHRHCLTDRPARPSTFLDRDCPAC